MKKKSGLQTWICDVYDWMVSFPQPWRCVRIKGDILSQGGTLRVSPGCVLEVTGNIALTKDVTII